MKSLATLVARSARLIPLVLGLCGIALASEPDAPLQVAAAGTFSGLFLDMVGADARLVVAPELEVRWSAANDWSIPTALVRGAQAVEFQTDEQADAISVSAQIPWSRVFDRDHRSGGVGVLDRFSTTFEGRMVEHWGGWTDGVMEWWHHLIGCSNFERNSYPRDAINLTLLDQKTGRGVDLHDSQFGLGDLVVRNQFLIVYGGTSFRSANRSRWGVSARFDFKAPLGTPAKLDGSGGWDAGVGVLGTSEIAPWLTMHVLAAAEAYSALSIPTPLQPKTWHYTGEVSFAALVGGTTLILEDRLTSPLFEGGWTFASPTSALDVISSGYYGAFRALNEISGGVRYGPVTFWFSEDFTPGSNSAGVPHWFYDSNSPDLAFGLTYSHSL